MTSLYQSTSSRSPVLTQTSKKRPAKQHFYFNMRDALSSHIARRDAILAVPEDRVLRQNFGRDIALDLSSEDKEFAALHFPIDRMFDVQI